MIYDYGYQRESKGWSVWLRCPYTGDRRDHIADVRSRRDAEALIRRLRRKRAP